MVMDEIDTCIRQSVLDSVQLEKFQETIRSFILKFTGLFITFRAVFLTKLK